MAAADKVWGLGVYGLRVEGRGFRGLRIFRGLGFKLIRRKRSIVRTVCTTLNIVHRVLQVNACAGFCPSTQALAPQAPPSQNQKALNTKNPVENPHPKRVIVLIETATHRYSACSSLESPVRAVTPLHPALNNCCKAAPEAAHPKPESQEYVLLRALLLSQQPAISHVS